MALLTSSKKIIGGQIQTITLQDSQTLTRNLVRMGIGSIAYLRGLFPDACFTNRMIAGMPIKTLTTRSADSEQLVKLIEEGILEAMKHDLIREIFLDVHEGDEVDENDSTLIERYQFKIMTPSSVDEGARREPTRKEVQERIASMMRQIAVITALLKPLPECKTIVIKLIYNLDAKIDAIDIPYFHPGEDYFEEREDTDAYEEQTLGEVNTKYHLVRLQLKSISKDRMKQRNKQAATHEHDPVTAACLGIEPRVLEALKPLRYLSWQALTERFGYTPKQSQGLIETLQKSMIIGTASKFGHEILKGPSELDQLIKNNPSPLSNIKMSQLQANPKRARIQAPSPATSLQLGIETPPLQQIQKEYISKKYQRIQ